MQLLEPPPKTSPLDSIRDLYREDLSALGHRVRVRGHAAIVNPDVVLLEDQWGAIEVDLAEPSAVHPGSAVEVVGFPDSNGLRIDLHYGQAREIPAAQLEPPPARRRPSPPSPSSENCLRSRQHWRCLLNSPAVITYSDPIWDQLDIQDSTGEIFVKYAGTHPELRAGLRARLTGISNPGNYAPVVVAAKFVVGGPGPTPVPIPATSDLASSGLLDSQFVSIEGIVHPLKFAEDPYHPVFTFELYTSLGQVHVYAAPGFPDLRTSRPLEDARVRIQGVFGTVFNSRRQLVGYQLQIRQSRKHPGSRTRRRRSVRHGGYAHRLVAALLTWLALRPSS